MDTASAPVNDIGTVTSPYERYAAIFSLVHAETKSIPTALEALDAYRAREQLPIENDLPAKVLEVAASLFSVPVDRLMEPGRQRDKTSARYVAAWVLARRHWSSGKIGELLGLEASTVRHGIIAVDKTDHLRSAACRVELLILGLPQAGAQLAHAGR
jgi:hypothetical protein